MDWYFPHYHGSVCVPHWDMSHYFWPSSQMCVTLWAEGMAQASTVMVHVISLTQFHGLFFQKSQNTHCDKLNMSSSLRCYWSGGNHSLHDTVSVILSTQFTSDEVISTVDFEHCETTFWTLLHLNNLKMVVSWLKLSRAWLCSWAAVKYL